MTTAYLEKWVNVANKKVRKIRVMDNVTLTGYIFDFVNPWKDDSWKNRFEDRLSHWNKFTEWKINGVGQRVLYIPKKEEVNSMSVDAHYYRLIGCIDIVKDLFKVRNGQKVTIVGCNYCVKSNNSKSKGCVFVEEIYIDTDKNIIDLDNGVATKNKSLSRFNDRSNDFYDDCYYDDDNC